MMRLTFGLFTQVSGSGPLGPLVLFLFFFPNFCLGLKHKGKKRISVIPSYLNYTLTNH